MNNLAITILLALMMAEAIQMKHVGKLFFVWLKKTANFTSNMIFIGRHIAVLTASVTPISS